LLTYKQNISDLNQGNRTLPFIEDKTMRTLVLLSLSLLLTGLASCSNPADPEEKQKQTPPPPPIDSVDLMLGDAMTAMVNSYFPNGDLVIKDSAFRPRDIDFTESFVGYKKIIDDPSAPDSTLQRAKYGAGFSGVMVFLADPVFNELIDEFKRVFDTMSFNPFNPTIRGGFGQMSSGSIVDFPGGVGPIGLPINSTGMLSVIPSPTTLERVISASALQSPTLSNLQLTLEDGLLAHIQESRRYLLDVLSDTQFVFIVTPEMRGNPGADIRKLDHNFSMALLATLYGAEAGLEIFFARELDLPAYTVAEAVIASSQNSPFLNLKSGGEQRMRKAGFLVDSANTYLRMAVNGWINEVVTNVDQSQDVFKVFPRDLADLSEVRDSLTSLEVSMSSGPRMLTLRNSYHPPFTISVDMRKLFDSPMQNPKIFSPGYSVSAEELVDAFKGFADAHYSRDLYWARLDSLFGLVRPNDFPKAPAHLPDSNTSEFYSLIAASTYGSFGISDSAIYILGWDDARTYCQGCADPLSSYNSSNHWRYQNMFRAPDQIAFCFNWTADDFASWTFPNETFNGLLPDMTSGELRNILSTNFRFVWEKSYCDTVGVNFQWPGPN
jgi:hypothetical protein